jgi:hypothetical protein
LSISWKTSASVREGRTSVGCCVNPELLSTAGSEISISGSPVSPSRIESSSSDSGFALSSSASSAVSDVGGPIAVLISPPQALISAEHC